jgi:hypothetical protein
MPTVAEAVHKFTQAGPDIEGRASEARRIIKALQDAFADARLSKLGWDGEIRIDDGGPYLLCLLDPEKKQIGYAIAWKAHLGGLTWVWSPLPLERLNAVAGTEAAMLGEDSGIQKAWNPPGES